MEKILVILYTQADGTISRTGFEAVKAALTLREGLQGSDLAVGLIGASIQPGADQLAGCGASSFLGVEGEEFASSRYSSDASAAESICKSYQPTMVVSPGSSRVNRVMPGVAHRMAGRADTHICEISASEGKVLVTRWYYRQRMRAVLERSSRPWFLVCDPASFSPWSGAPGSAEVQRIEVKGLETGTRVEGFQEPAGGEQTIRPDAEVLLVAGAGWTKRQGDGTVKVDQAEGLILDFLKHTGASLGGSKSMVDLSSEGQKVLSCMTHLNQIGQTGATPRHPKGLATCCHGEEPHAVGWRFINERRAINMDPNCGWAQGKADVLYVEDAFAVMRKVNELLAEGSD